MHKVPNVRLACKPHLPETRLLPGKIAGLTPVFHPVRENGMTAEVARRNPRGPRMLQVSPTLRRLKLVALNAWFTLLTAAKMPCWRSILFIITDPTVFMTVDWESFTEQTVETAEVRLLGLADLASVLALQKLMVHEVRRQSRLCAAVLICEHPPAITTGTGSSLLDLPTDPRELQAKLLSVHRVSRGGGTLLHQPGQLAIYVVVSLDECGFGENEFPWRLQEAIIRTCDDSRVRASRRTDDKNAVWGRHGLVCEIATAVEDGVTSFGAFLNVSCPLDDARQFGRGLRGDRISSLNAERVRPSIMSQVRSSLIKHVCEQIGYPEYHIHTGHPFLTRQRKIVGHPKQSGAFPD